MSWGVKLKLVHHAGINSVLLLACCLVFVSPSNAQRYPFFNIGIEQGLVQSQVFSLAQDNAGHLWAGTLGGLACYDGHSFRNFTVRDGLPSNSIMSLACDYKSMLWIGTERGLSCYDGHTFHNYSFSGPDNPRGNRVIRLSISPDGTVWCVAGKSLYNVRNGKVASVPLPTGYEEATAIHVDKKGILWLGVRGAISLFHSAPNKHWDSLKLPEPAFIHRIYEDSKNQLVLLTGHGVFRREHLSWNCLLHRNSKSEPLPYGFTEATDGSVWISNTMGVTTQIFSRDNHRKYSKQNGLTDVLIHDMITDREGNIWLASNGEGLFRFSGAAFTAIDERMGLTSPQVSSIAKDAYNIIYFGSFDGGLFSYKNGKVSPITFPDIKTPTIGSIAMHDGILWIGTQSAGLWKYTPATGSMKRYANEHIGVSVSNLMPDATGLYLTSTKGIAQITKDSLKNIPITSAPVESFTRIGRDSLLLATAGGLMLRHNDSTYHFVTNSAADSAQIVCMNYRAGTVWLGTVDDGVFGYDLGTGKVIHVSRANGLRSDFIYNIYAAPDGCVWAGTGYGICRIKLDKAFPQVTFYGRSAGVTGMESNKNAVLPLSDGSIWFGTTSGALLYHPENVPAATQPVSVQLQGVQLFGNSVPDTSWYSGTTAFYNVPTALNLPWRQNNLSFSFAAISLTGTEGISYRYQLVGLNAPWSDWSANNTINFSALPPGSYTLEVQCSTDGNTPQPQTLRYAFEIITPFHKTGWFRLLIIAGCILLGVALQYIAARRKRARLAMIEGLRRDEQAKVRQRTAEDFHDEVGNRITRINVLTNVLRSKVEATPEATRIIEKIQDNTGQLYSGTRDILWSLQPANDSLFQVLQRIRDFGCDLFGDTEVSFDMQGIQPEWKDHRLPMDLSRNLIMIFKEALNNALKYSMADKVNIQVSAVGGNLFLSLTDDGKGFDPAKIARGQGLINMKTRTARLGGTIQIDTGCGEGTSIGLTFKIPGQPVN